MGKKLRRKIFFSWVAGLICGTLAKGIIDKSLKFSLIFGIAMACILTLYFVADYYDFFNTVKDEIESWF